MVARCRYNKIKCFAYDHGSCKILTDTDYTSARSKAECAFYKTVQQFKDDRIQADRRLIAIERGVIK